MLRPRTPSRCLARRLQAPSIDHLRLLRAPRRRVAQASPHRDHHPSQPNLSQRLKILREDCLKAGSEERTTWAGHTMSTIILGKQHGHAQRSALSLSRGPRWMRTHKLSGRDTRTVCCRKIELVPIHLRPQYHRPLRPTLLVHRQTLCP